MKKGVVMKKRINNLFRYVLFGLMIGVIFGQSSGYLAQKLMLENSLRKRIGDALEKVIDNRKYVVDVSVDLEISSAVENQTTFSPSGSIKSLNSAENLLLDNETPTTGGVGLPIPGFDFTAENTTEEENEVETKMDSPVDDNVVSRTKTEKLPSMASVKNLEISIIIQEGAAPELIENIRQVVMVASRFNRARGDVLSIMTASFKERRDEKSAEQVLLKNIAEKLESLEDQRERLGEVDWKEELENYKDSEEERRQEDRLYFQSKLAEMETAARDQSYDQEREAMLRQDSVRLQALNEEIQNLKSFLGTADISDSAATAAQSSVQQKLGEKETLDAQTKDWGIKVNNVEIKDIDLNENMIRAIAKQAEAERVRRAKVIHAEGELEASKKLLDAATTLSEQPQALQLRYMQTLADIAGENNSTIVFPMPIEFIRAFGAGKEKS